MMMVVAAAVDDFVAAGAGAVSGAQRHSDASAQTRPWGEASHRLRPLSAPCLRGARRRREPCRMDLFASAAARHRAACRCRPALSWPSLRARRLLNTGPRAATSPELVRRHR